MELLAKKKATAKIRLGVLGCFGQTSAMGYFIFYASSWDTMEALTWVTSAFWMLFGSVLFLRMGIDMDIGAYQSLINKELEKLKKNADFDIEKEDFLVNYIEELKTFEEYLEQDASDE